MELALLNLNDYCVQLFAGGEQQFADGGLVHFGEQQLLYGVDAHDLSRINPARSVNIHWAQLNEQQLQLPHADYRHAADIAFHQIQHWLQYLPQPTPLVIAPHYNYSKQQLALLAGIFYAHKLTLNSFVDPALLQGLGYLQQASDLPARFFHLDMCLHQARLCQLEIVNGQLKRTDLWEFADFGLTSLQQQWLQWIASECIAQTRYDPMHNAESEQRLFNQLSEVIQQLSCSTKLSLDIDGNAVILQQSKFNTIAQSFVDQIQAISAGETLLLSPQAIHLSGLQGVQLEQQHWLDGLYAAEDFLLQQPALKMHLGLPLPAQLVVTSQSTSSYLNRPTHLLCQGRAFELHNNKLLAIDEGQLLVTTQSQDHCFAKLEHNGRHWQLTPIAEKKNITIEGKTFTEPVQLLLNQPLWFDALAQPLTPIEVVNGS